MKKDILIVFAVILALAVFIGGSNFQSVDEYYLVHIDDIEDDSETVFIEIRCDDILNHLDDLDKSLNSPEYVPSDGVILPLTEYVLRPGDTAFDLLSRCIRRNRIQMEYQGLDKNAFGSVYIQSINYIYEFSCGPQSGWIFTVNGEVPDKGCSAFELADGDRVSWIYSCSLDEAF
ncbi:MAG: DUF4430 domain-containing protein [Oscillospiraceae bacterium]|nr:DUF4430 domain-containing protein [Oscillospiraceae bacterium]